MKNHTFCVIQVYLLRYFKAVFAWYMMYLMWHQSWHVLDVLTIRYLQRKFNIYLKVSLISRLIPYCIIVEQKHDWNTDNVSNVYDLGEYNVVYLEIKEFHHNQSVGIHILISTDCDNKHFTNDLAQTVFLSAYSISPRLLKMSYWDTVTELINTSVASLLSHLGWYIVIRPLFHHGYKS